MAEFNLTFLFISQTITLVIWSIFSPPQPTSLPTGSGEMQVFCSFPLGPFIASMAFNMILLLVCAGFAVKARNLPDNFNECRFISFCALSTVILWMAFGASYFMTISIYRVLFLALMIFINGLIMHGGLFLPKLYVVYFVQRQKTIEPFNKMETH